MNALAPRYHPSVVSAIILAAGESIRMGSPKALLKAPGGQSFAGRISAAFSAAGISRLVIVTGVHHDAIVQAVTGDCPQLAPVFVRNPDPSRGQLSSLWAGMDLAIEPDTEALLVTLVDVPMMTAEVVRQVVEAWQATRAPIVRPAIGDVHGHPVLYDRSLFEALRRAPLDQGAKAVVRARERDILNVQVTDRGCLMDIDTPEDYRTLVDS